MNKPLDNDPDKWESTCNRCARCCYQKIDFEGKIYYTEEPCKFLDLKTKLCRVYEDRDTKRPGCVRLTLENVAKGFLPADCPYVADIEGYPAPSLPDEDDVEDC